MEKRINGSFVPEVEIIKKCFLFFVPRIWRSWLTENRPLATRGRQIGNKGRDAMRHSVAQILERHAPPAPLFLLPINMPVQFDQ
jgi:hypothetical protein